MSASPLRRAGALLFALSCYVGLLIVAQLLDRHFALTGGLRLAVALLPMLGAIGVVAVVLRTLRQLDELQRRIQLEAIGLAFLGTAFITFAWGFAQDAGLPALHPFMIWPLMATLWCVGLIVAVRRYA